MAAVSANLTSTDVNTIGNRYCSNSVDLDITTPIIPLTDIQNFLQNHWSDSLPSVLGEVFPAALKVPAEATSLANAIGKNAISHEEASQISLCAFLAAGVAANGCWACFTLSVAPAMDPAAVITGLNYFLGPDALYYRYYAQAHLQGDVMWVRVCSVESTGYYQEHIYVVSAQTSPPLVVVDSHGPEGTVVGDDAVILGALALALNPGNVTHPVGSVNTHPCEIQFAINSAAALLKPIPMAPIPEIPAPQSRISDRPPSLPTVHIVPSQTQEQLVPTPDRAAPRASSIQLPENSAERQHAERVSILNKLISSIPSAGHVQRVSFTVPTLLQLNSVGASGIKIPTNISISIEGTDIPSAIRNGLHTGAISIPLHAELLRTCMLLSVSSS